MSRHLLISILIVAASACSGTTTTPASELNLDRPVDVSFACYGGLRITNGNPAKPDDAIVSTGQPIEACNVRSGAHEATAPVPVPPGQEDLTAMGGRPVPPAAWYAFILQSGPGTVAIASFATQPSSSFVGNSDVNVLDADPLTPGKNSISVGEDPIAITTDKQGCYEVIANAGSCDLSTLEVATALDADPAVHVDRLAVKSSTGTVIRAKPAAMVGEPGTTVIGESCSPEHATGIVYIAYPGCHLVAAVDAATGTIVGGVQFDPAGTATMTTGNVSCPDECGGGGTVTAGMRPVALDLELDPRTLSRRLVIGSDNSSNLTLVELGTDSLPLSVRPIALQNTTGSIGVTAVALTPQIGMGGTAGIVNDVGAPGGQFQFVYAITTDETVRVADILTLDKECDTQVDPRLINDVRNIRTLSCFPVGDPTTPARRPGARGPGIELVGTGIPTSIEIFRVDPDGDNELPGPTKLVGYFGVITASNGASFLLNVDDDNYADFKDAGDPLLFQLPLAIGHQLRDALPSRDAKATGSTTDADGVTTTYPICETNGIDPDSQTPGGGPRATAPPTRNVPTGNIAAEKIFELPSIRQVKCVGNDSTKPVSELAFAAPVAVRDLAFPDLRGLTTDETWSLTYEGALSLDSTSNAVDGPSVRQSQIFVDAAGMRIVDQSRPFCDAGVETFDIAQLRGCDPALGDADCPLGYACYVHPNSQVVGLGSCMLSDEADRLANACRDFLTSLRRYTVGRSESGALKLLPRKHVLSTTPVDGCVDDTQCTTLADYAVKATSSAHPINDGTPPSTHTYSCMVDPDRAPLTGPGQTGKRCVETCSATVACTAGRICQGLDPNIPDDTGVCMEGVIPPQACVNAPQRYDLRASEAFTVIGTRSGYVHQIIADSTGKCVKDPNPNLNPFIAGRIPLNPPDCNPAADPRTGRLPGGQFGPNPCLTTVEQTELAPAYVPGTCNPASPSPALVSRQAPAIQFHNRGMTFHIVDPTYPGDASCIGDRAGGLGKVPSVFIGYQLTFRQTAGFTPLLIAMPSPGPSYPIKVVRGPTQSIWVIDEGDYLSTTVTLSSTRGKVYRIEPQALGLINLLE